MFFFTKICPFCHKFFILIIYEFLERNLRGEEKFPKKMQNRA